MTETVLIEGRFHGPPDSANGGYCCGLVAAHIDGPATVRLRVPPPLDVPLEVRPSDGGVGLFHGDQLVATGRPARPDVELPPAPGFDAAVAASNRFRGFASHFFPGCFVCGTDRGHGDGLRIFAGPLESGAAVFDGMVAAPWIPTADLADSAGRVADEFLWAALDCPGAFCFPEPESGSLLLGELTVEIRGQVAAGEKCVVAGWEISRDGRKHKTGTALFGASGSCLAAGLATWIEALEPAPGRA